MTAARVRNRAQPPEGDRRSTGSAPDRLVDGVGDGLGAGHAGDVDAPSGSAPLSARSPGPPLVLDRRSPVPLWSQLAGELRRQVESGELGSAFPTDVALMARFGVSRQTVREAVRHLVLDGLVERQRGRGSRVRPAEFEQPLGSLYSLFRAIEAQGARQTSEVLALDERTDSAVAAQLGLAADEALVYLERVRLAGGAPLAVDQAWMPASVARPLLSADFRHTALYDELATRCGVAPDGGREQVRPVLPSAHERAVLRLPRDEAVFLVERRTWAGVRPLEVRRTVVRGDRFALVGEWPASSTRAGEVTGEPAASRTGDPPVLRLLPTAAGDEVLR
jgi:GntR family transcriptional regulator